MQKIYKKYFAIFTLPTLIAYAIAFVVPFFMGLYLSFCKFKTIGNAKWVGLSNYLYVFQDSNGFLAALWFTVKIAVVGVITTNVIAFALALLLTRGLKGTNAFRTIFFMPNLIGGIIKNFKGRRSECRRPGIYRHHRTERKRKKYSAEMHLPGT